VGRPISRRAFLAATGAAFAATSACTIDHAFRADPAGSGSLADIDHFVLLMQENRSFDHYFGTLPGVDGLRTATAQAVVARNLGDPLGRRPFRLRTRGDASTDLILADPAHTWSAQHKSWNGGALDRWLPVHAADDGPDLAPAVMGYYTRAELPVHYGLADAFTVCDRYFCSVLGPTAPNRLYWMSATLDPQGRDGGPIVGALHTRGALTWTTFPERLQDAGVSWKVYNALPPDRYSALTGMLRYFRNFQDPQAELYRRGLAPTWPGDFARDVRAGTLPAVSWIIPSMFRSEHPDFPPAVGAETIMYALTALVANPKIWERTALIVSYDENGGFFDHVAPPTPQAVTTDEYVSLRRHRQQAPIGLGFRVPCLVISPYSRGGRVFSQTLDHTSQLRLIGRRFGVDVPNLSAWRQDVTGDMTASLARAHGTPSRLALPSTRSVQQMSRDAVAQRSRAQRGDA
jgi:phospholipase C